MKKIAAALGAILLVTGVKAQKQTEVSKTTTPQTNVRTGVNPNETNIKVANKVFPKSTLKTSIKDVNLKTTKSIKFNKQLKTTTQTIKASK